MEPIETFEWNGVNSPSLEMLLTIAELMGVHPTELEPLSNVIDPDALDSLFAPARESDHGHLGHLQFQYYDYCIEISASGKGYIYPRTAGFPSTPASAMDLAEPRQND